MSKYEFPPQEVEQERHEHMKGVRLDIHKLSDRLGFGEGSISAEVISKRVGEDVMLAVDEVINSPAILVPIDKDKDGHTLQDDGCGDGRWTKRIFRGRTEFHRSLHRKKVFGGGAAMALADLVGSGEAANLPLESAFHKSIVNLVENKIDFGAHTADHATDGKSGCGAIDESATALSLAGKYRQRIKDTFDLFEVPTQGLDSVINNFESYASQVKDQKFMGSNITNVIKYKWHKVVKELGGPHVEARKVFNFIPGYTVNQRKVREASDGQVDVFAVDIWHMQELAEKLHPKDEAAQVTAFQSMLVYTIAVAATLTKGDAPIYTVKMVPKSAAAPALV